MVVVIPVMSFDKPTDNPLERWRSGLGEVHSAGPPVSRPRLSGCRYGRTRQARVLLRQASDRELWPEGMFE